jgi:hypothetical protein
MSNQLIQQTETAQPTQPAQSSQPITFPRQICNIYNPEEPHRNEFWPWRDGHFTTCISWIETVQNKGQRAQWVKYDASKQSYTNPPKHTFSDLVFAMQRLNGIIDFKTYNLASMTREEVYSLETLYTLTEYQREILNKYFNEELQTDAPAYNHYTNNNSNNNNSNTSETVFTNVRKPGRPAKVFTDEETAQITTNNNLEKWAKEIEKIVIASRDLHLSDKQVKLLRDVAYFKPEMLPGTIEPFMFANFNAEMLARACNQPKDNYEHIWSMSLESKTDPVEREAFIALTDKLRPQNEARALEHESLNQLWYEQETLRREQED